MSNYRDNPKSGELDKVIAGGYCIGCGACSVGQHDSGINVKLNEFGRFQAELPPQPLVDPAKSAAVCPFSDTSVNEDILSADFLRNRDMTADTRMGRYSSIHVGRVKNVGYCERGSSGGFTSWILAELIQRGMVDAIIHVKPRTPDAGDKRLFEYGVSTTLEELNRGAKSHYYPVEMSGVLEHIRTTPGRYAVVGVPCFIKALRLLSKEQSIFHERIKFCVGLFCGHLKSTGFAEMLAWQCGIRPDQLQAVDFRTKLPDRPSSNYGITARGLVNGQEISQTRVVAELAGTDWGMGFFKYKACDFCDDISAETADVSVGDAWLAQFVSDSRGTNVVIVRNPQIQSMIEDGIRSGTLDFSPLTADFAAESQSANFRHRRQDLAYRLHLKDVAKEWRPRKRVEAASMCEDKERKTVQDFRMRFRDEVPLLWREAVKAGRLEMFLQNINPLIQDYRALYGHPPKTKNGWLCRVKNKFKRCLGLFK